MAMDSLVKFSSEVIKTAEGHRENALAKVRKREKERLATVKTDIQSKKLSKIRIECTKIKLESDKEISILKNDLNKEIFKRRSEMFDDVFAEVTKAVAEYKTTSDYRETLIKSLKSAIEEMGGEHMECFALPEDVAVLSKEFSAVEFKEAGIDIIGGFSLLCKEKGLYLDMTLKSKIEEQKKKFYRKSGLVLNQ